MDVDDSTFRIPFSARQKQSTVKIVEGSVVEIDDFIIPERARPTVATPTETFTESPTHEEGDEEIGQLPSFTTRIESRSTPATSPATSITPSVDVKTRSRRSTILNKMGIGNAKKTVEKKKSFDARERALSDPVSKSSKMERAKYVKASPSQRNDSSSLTRVRFAGQDERKVDQGTLASIPRARTRSPADISALLLEPSRYEHSQSARSKSVQYRSRRSRLDSFYVVQGF